MDDDHHTGSDKGELTPEELRKLLDSAISASEASVPEAENAEATVGAKMVRLADRLDAKLSDRDRKLKKVVAEISRRIDEQLAEIMHHKRFLQLEGSWRGLQHLVQTAEADEADEMVQIQVLHCTKQELQEDFEGGAEDFDLTRLFQLTYESPFELPGGLPYSVLIGDYQFDHVTPGDLVCLETLGNVAAASMAPLITSPSSRLFGAKNWSEFNEISGLSTLFESAEYVKWRKIRESEASRYIVMAMPRASQSSGRNNAGDDGEYFSWMNPAYLLAARLVSTFPETHWFFEIEDVGNAGDVEAAGAAERRPVRSQEEPASAGNTDLKFRPELSFQRDRVDELSKLGFLSLYHDARNDRLAIVSSQTLHKPKVYDQDAATQNAAVMARLQFVLISSRFCHYLQILCREGLVGCSGMEAIEDRLTRWICQYAGSPEGADYGEEMRARYPLEEVKIKVESIPDFPGYYRAKVYLRPWLPKDRLSDCCYTSTLTLRSNI